MRMNPVPPRSFDTGLLARIEDAGLNASAPPQQRWMDGWLLRFSPGKAKRARCVNAVAAGRLALADKLQRCEAVYAEAQLPLLVRIDVKPEKGSAWPTLLIEPRRSLEAGCPGWDPTQKRCTRTL